MVGGGWFLLFWVGLRVGIRWGRGAGWRLLHFLHFLHVFWLLFLLRLWNGCFFLLFWHLRRFLLDFQALVVLDFLLVLNLLLVFSSFCSWTLFLLLFWLNLLPIYLSFGGFNWSLLGLTNLHLLLEFMLFYWRRFYFCRIYNRFLLCLCFFINMILFFLFKFLDKLLFLLSLLILSAGRMVLILSVCRFGVCCIISFLSICVFLKIRSSLG